MGKSVQSMPLILRVAVIAPLDRYLDYLPLEEGAVPIVGARVRVHLQNQRRVGIVMAHVQQAEVAVEKLRTIEEVVDSGPIFSDHLLQLLRWASQYYHYPIGKVLHTTLPRLLRQGNAITKNFIRVWHAQNTVDTGKDLLKRAKKQKALFEFLRDQSSDETALRANFPGWRSALRELIRKELVYCTESQVRDDTVVPTAKHHTLNDEQADAVRKIRESLGRFSCHLLEGVTGSGKTEIYLQLIRRIISEGGQAMVLVPEIGLTSQTVRQFRERFGSVVAVLHSGLSDRHRFRSWCKSMLNEVKIIIGTRSVVFTACNDLRLIVVDEEHDLSYKQQDTLRYHARDLAIKRAQLLDIPIILGSATPSLESLHNVLEKRYRWHRLSHRVGGAQLPQYRVLDIRGQPLTAGLSLRLIEMMRRCLERDEQVLLFLNRRGYAPKFLCHDCGTVIECPRCDLPLTYHLSKNNLYCHHCEYKQLCPDCCPNCRSDCLKMIGFGTERIERELRQIFPATKIVRIDADTTRRKGELEKYLKAIRSGDAKILVGTQMISKGHHFPDVTLIGIVNVDQRLFAFDFRSLERLGQLIIQVSGRAGRGQRPGVVALQTYHPDNVALQCLIRQNYHQFAKTLLAQRHLNQMPPYRYLAVFRAESKDEFAPQCFLKEVATIVHKYQLPKVELFGPVPAPTEKKIGVYHAQLMLSAEQRFTLNRCLSKGMAEILQLRAARGTTWHVDVDPMELE